MRITLSIDDDVLTRIKNLAHAWNIPIGRLVSEMLRHQLDVTMTERDGFPVFVPPPGFWGIGKSQTHICWRSPSTIMAGS